MRVQGSSSNSNSNGNGNGNGYEEIHEEKYYDTVEYPTSMNPASNNVDHPILKDEESEEENDAVVVDSEDETFGDEIWAEDVYVDSDSDSEDENGVESIMGRFCKRRGPERGPMDDEDCDCSVCEAYELVSDNHNLGEGDDEEDMEDDEDITEGMEEEEEEENVEDVVTIQEALEEVWLAVRRWTRGMPMPFWP